MNGAGLGWKLYVCRCEKKHCDRLCDSVNENAYNKILDFKILERVDSDHLPL